MLTSNHCLGLHAAPCTAPIKIHASVAGIGINYFLDPRLARATWIWPALLCFSLASVFGTLTHVRRFKALKARR
jgi:hypothetical protein